MNLDCFLEKVVGEKGLLTIIIITINKENPSFQEAEKLCLRSMKPMFHVAKRFIFEGFLVNLEGLVFLFPRFFSTSFPSWTSG